MISGSSDPRSVLLYSKVLCFIGAQLRGVLSLFQVIVLQVFCSK